jgi:hypothetical protein
MPDLPSAPRRIVPVSTPEVTNNLASAQQTADVTYHGGRVLTAVEVVTIFWGSAWTQSQQQTVATGVNAFFDSVLSSGLMDVLAEYSVAGQSIGHGTRVATVTVTDIEPGGGSGTVSDADIRSALQAWVKGAAVPPATANTLYFIYLPPGVTSTLQGQQSCQAYCGYHQNAGGIVYAVEPYPDCAGCNFGSTVLDSLTVVSSHELCEAITDPDGDGWYDGSTGNEIGDICVGDVADLGGYAVQREWSNAKGACVI